MSARDAERVPEDVLAAIGDLVEAFHRDLTVEILTRGRAQRFYELLAEALGRPGELDELDPAPQEVGRRIYQVAAAIAAPHGRGPTSIWLELTRRRQAGAERAEAEVHAAWRAGVPRVHGAESPGASS